MRLCCQGVEGVSRTSDTCKPLSAQSSRCPRQIARPLRLWGVGMFAARLRLGVKVLAELEIKVMVMYAL